MFLIIFAMGVAVFHFEKSPCNNADVVCCIFTSVLGHLKIVILIVLQSVLTV